MNKSAARIPVWGSAMLLSFSTMGIELDDFGMDQDFAAMDGLESDQFEMPVVLTAARLRQSQLDTPASVTVIEADTIAALGFKNIEEIFRLVPGMLVGYHSGFGEKAASVSYHGTNASEHRRLQVLVDGRSVFKPGLARVEWVDIPLAVEDIKRIEVIRGPNSAAYGANSYLGIINILTKHPSEEKGTTAKVTVGNRDVADTYFNVSNSFAGTEFRWTLGSKNKSGFDVQTDLVTENRDDSDAIYTTLRTFTPITAQFSMEWQAGYKEGTNEQIDNLGELDYNTREDVDAKDSYLWVKLNNEFTPNQFSHIQLYTQKFDRVQEWNACLDEDFAAEESLPIICGDLNKNLVEVKSEFEFQHTSYWNDDLRTVAGFRIRNDHMDSATYSDGIIENNNYSAFTNVEYTLNQDVVFNVGGMYEDDELNGENFSPRLAVNYHLDDKQTLRFIYSEAIRSPDIFEQNGQVVYLVENASVSGNPIDDVPFPIGQSTGTLDNERIYSHEISYFSLIPSIQGQIDIKLFYDVLTGLITQALDHDPDKPLASENKIIHTGIEGQFKINVNASNQLMLGLSYLYTDDDFAGNNVDVQREQSLTADRSGSLTWISDLTDRTKLGMAYYHVENWNEVRAGSSGGFTFSRLDANVSHDIDITPDYHLKLQATVQYRLDDDPLLFQRNNYEDKEHYYLTAQLNF